MKKVVFSSILCAMIMALAHYPLTHAQDGNNTLFPEGIIYTGAFLGWGEFEDNVTMEALTSFESLSQKRIALVPFSVFFGEGVGRLSENLEAVSRYGAVPIVRLMPWRQPYWGDPDDSKYDLKEITGGHLDGLLLNIANIIKKFEGNVIVTFGVEMNGDWFPWSGVFQGGGKTSGYGDPSKADGPELFKDAFRYVVDFFRASGATNCLWMFHVNHESYPDEEWNVPKAYYPGDEYIDLIGVSIYGKQYEDEPWTDFETLVRASLEGLRAISETRPYIIAEWGVGQWAPYDKAQWYRDALKSILEDFSFFKAAIIYSERWENDDGTFSDLRIDSSTEALEAYREGISDQRFCGMACALMGQGSVAPKLYVNGKRLDYEEKNSADLVELSLSLDVMEEREGRGADWWVFAKTQFGTFSLVLDPELRWSYGLSTIYGGGITPIPMVPFLEVSGLPQGIYDFYFVVDLERDSTLDGPIYCSMVRVRVR